MTGNENNWQDPIVEEVRLARDEHAARFQYDLGAICADLRQRQQSSGRKILSLPPRKTDLAHKKTG